MKTLICTGLFLLLFTSAQAEFRLMAATGIFSESSSLAEISVSTTDMFQVSASYGIFKGNQYADGGLALQYKRVTIGCAAAYLYTIPEQLTGHLQYKGFLEVEITEVVSAKYIHFSNGAGFMAHDRYPNRGMNYLGLMARF